MIFNFFQKALFLPENKTINDLKNEIFSIIEHLKQIQNVYIYMENPYNIISLLLASIILDKKPIICNENMPNAINDENYKKLKNLDYKIFKINKNIYKNNFYIQTSGSSGKAKLIEKTLEQVFLEAKFLKNKFNFKKDDIFTASASCNHFFGLIFRLFIPLISGGTIYTKPFLIANDISNFNQKHIFITSPIILENMIKSNQKFNNIQRIFTAGSKLSKTVREEISNITSAEVINIYGSTETGVIAYDIGNGLKAFSKVNISLDNENKLYVSSPWANFQTNDLANIDGKKLYLLGRADRVIKQNDRRIHLDILEDEIKTHLFIQDCACKVINNKLIALITLSELAKNIFRKSGRKEIIETLKKHIYINFKNCIKTYKIVDYIPRNNNNKVSIDNFLQSLNKNIKPQFKFKKQDNNVYIFNTILQPECYFFQGHFNNFAVLPGYLQLEMIFKLAKIIGIDLYECKTIKNLKFNGFIRPLDEIIVYITNNNSFIAFEIKNNNKICSSGKILL